MIDWAVVSAFIGPLIGAIGTVAGLFAWLGKRRDARVALLIDAVTTKLDLRISQVERQIADQGIHLDRQDAALTSAMQAIARIEGRLQGPITVTAARDG